MFEAGSNPCPPNAHERAAEYLDRRGLNADTISQFGIGYAPDSWNALLKRFGSNDGARRKLSAAGLIVERTGQTSRDADGGFYDRFRDRIMFPIRDARSRVIAFGGRIIDAGEPKYMNSPETSVFHKGKELYGLYEARQARQALTRLLIVEGYMRDTSAFCRGEPDVRTVDDEAAGAQSKCRAIEHQRITRITPECILTGLEPIESHQRQPTGL